MGNPGLSESPANVHGVDRHGDQSRASFKSPFSLIEQLNVREPSPYSGIDQVSERGTLWGLAGLTLPWLHASETAGLSDIEIHLEPLMM